MLVKFTYPADPLAYDYYFEMTSFAPRLEGQYLVFDGLEPEFLLDGLFVYILDPATGKTIDRPKLPVAHG